MKARIATPIFPVLVRAALAAAFVVFAAAPVSAKDLPKLMVFDTEFVDMMVSGTGESFTTQEDISRSKQVSEIFREELAAHYKILTPSKDAGPYDLSCTDCILTIAKDQHADLVLTSALSRMNSRTVFLKYQLGDVAKNKRLGGGDIELNGYTARQIRLAAHSAIKDLLKEAPPTEKAATPR